MNGLGGGNIYGILNLLHSTPYTIFESNYTKILVTKMQLTTNTNSNFHLVNLPIKKIISYRYLLFTKYFAFMPESLSLKALWSYKLILLNKNFIVRKADL